jgi:hypothetical protein
LTPELSQDPDSVSPASLSRGCVPMSNPNTSNASGQNGFHLARCPCSKAIPTSVSVNFSLIGLSARDLNGLGQLAAHSRDQVVTLFLSGDDVPY